jgi:hypothetical protein
MHLTFSRASHPQPKYTAGLRRISEWFQGTVSQATFCSSAEEGVSKPQVSAIVSVLKQNMSFKLNKIQYLWLETIWNAQH